MESNNYCQYYRWWLGGIVFFRNSVYDAKTYNVSRVH